MYLGIDLGTSAVKACVMDAAGRIVATASGGLAARHPFDGASEQECADWWAATCTAVGALDAALRAQVRAVGLSGQMHGAVLLDAGHRPLRPVILWNDARAEAECAEMLAADPAIGRIAGVPPMAGFTAPKLLWLSRHEPALHARIAHVLLPKDYIGLCLHGGLLTDPCDASGSSWYDVDARRWSGHLCRISATDPAWLPEVRHGSDVAGPLRAAAAMALGLPAGIPVAVGAGDAAAGAVGIGATAAGEGFISLGTSGQVFVTTDAHRPNPEGLIHAYAHTLPGRWFQMAAMLNGARPMAWLAGILGRPIAELLAEAEAAPPGPLFLPYLTGERTPHGDSAIRAGFALLGETTTPGALMRAVVEAVAFSLADAMEALSRTGTRTGALLAVGGGTRSDFLMQTIADVTGCRLGRSDAADVGPALGAARLALLAHGTDDPEGALAKPATRHWFEPRKEPQAALSGRLAAYRALYPALRTVQATLRDGGAR